jgi:hypothetical protein
MFIQFFPYFLHINNCDDTQDKMHRYNYNGYEDNIKGNAKTAMINRHNDYNLRLAVVQVVLSTTLRFPIHCRGILAR